MKIMKKTSICQFFLLCFVSPLFNFASYNTWIGLQGMHCAKQHVSQTIRGPNFFLYITSWWYLCLYHRIAEVGNDLWRLSSPTPSAQSRVHRNKLHNTYTERTACFYYIFFYTSAAGPCSGYIRILYNYLHKSSVKKYLVAWQVSYTNKNYSTNNYTTNKRIKVTAITYMLSLHGIPISP